MAVLLPALLKAENALATSLPIMQSAEALQAHRQALQTIQELIRSICAS